MNVMLTRIDSPHITEKSTRLKEATNTLCFRINRDSTKVDVRSAVEKIFGVKVESVRIVRVKGKPKRVGRHLGKSAN